MFHRTSTPPPPPPEKKPSRTAVRIGAVLATIIIVIVVFASVFILVINRPRPEITLVNGYESLQGLNYVFKVDATVKNNGASGWVKVYASISGAGRYEKQDQRIYLASGESRSLQFVFDISLWGALSSPSISYKAWAVAD